MAKLIILDRDGVINQELTPKQLSTPEQWQELPNSLSAIAKLKQAGFTVCVATNQSIISKKIITMNILDTIHQKMHQKLQALNTFIDQIFICPHQASDNCLCRKPKPGLLLAAANSYNIDPKKQQIPFVGDSITDLSAAIAGGFIPILVKTGKGQETLKNLTINTIKNLLIFDDLNAFTDYWINAVMP